MSERPDYRARVPAPPGQPPGWAGTSQMPMQALGAPPPDLPPTGEYSPYPPPTPRRPAGRPDSSGGEPRSGRSKAVDYTLKGVGLLGVAVASGLLWYLIRNNPAPAGQPVSTAQQQPSGLYGFQLFHDPTVENDCGPHATNKVQKFFVQHPCLSLTRSLYTTFLTGNQKVITSVAVVKMSGAADATQLRALSDGNGTGHVKDLLEEGVVVPNGPDNLENAGYASKQKTTTVTIVSTEYIDKDLDTKANLDRPDVDSALKSVSQDALRQNLGSVH